MSKGVTRFAKLGRPFSLLYIVAALVGLIASFALTVDTIKLAANPNYQPACNINPIISCGSIMQTKEADALGFTNSILGLIGFGMILAIGVAMMAGAQMRRWFWQAIMLGLSFGLIFVHWLFYQSVYNINALCPYCMAVWVISIALFWYTLLFCLNNGFLILPARFSDLKSFLLNHHLDIYIGWLVIITLLILKHFWYYYGS